MTQDRFEGALIGLATGDALGTTVEFQSPGTFPPVTDMVGGGNFHLKPGQWTDDTSMALCLAESLVECGTFDARDQIERYIRWRDQGHLSSNGKCFDIGGAVGSALRTYEHTGNPYAGSEDPGRAGNGSLMRLAPVVLFYANDPEKAIYYAGESSRTTHQAPTAISACRYFAALLLGALQERSKEEILGERFTPVPGIWEQYPLAPEIAEIASGSFKVKEPPAIMGTGYVVRSLEAALWAFDRTSSFEEGCLKAVNLGDDADTTGAIYGQLAGAFYGRSGIPERWWKKLALLETIDDLLQRMWNHAPAVAQ